MNSSSNETKASHTLTSSVFPSPIVLPPNHCIRVFMLGLAAWIIGLLGLFAIGTGMDELQKIKDGKMRPEGRGFMIFGMISGVLGFLVNIGFILHQCASGNF